MAYATETIFVVGLYALCSAGMLIINKLAVYHIGVPSFVTLCQFAVTAGTVLVGRQLGLLVIDPHDWNKIKHFVVYVLAFSMGTWSNMKVLMVANVETIIVFRACSPIVVSFFDYWCYGRAFPSPRSLVAMLTILAGALSYVLNDREFQVQGVAAYTWVAVWFVLLVFQLCYGKHLVTGLGLTSMWSSVLYTNGLSCMPTSGIGFISGEYGRLGDVVWTTHGVFWLGASCVVGTGISWAGFKCQSIITAAAYTVVGVVRTVLAVLATLTHLLYLLYLPRSMCSPHSPLRLPTGEQDAHGAAQRAHMGRARQRHRHRQPDRLCAGRRLLPAGTAARGVQARQDHGDDQHQCRRRAVSQKRQGRGQPRHRLRLAPRAPPHLREARRESHTCSLVLHLTAETLLAPRLVPSPVLPRHAGAP